MKKILLVCFITVALNACVDTQSPSQIKENQSETADSSKEITDTTLAIVPQNPIKPFSNPVMLPNGSSIGNVLKAYYLTGQFKKMLPFMIIKNGDNNAFLKKIETLDWGYPIKLTNCEWLNDSEFTIYYNATINNTQKLEIYRGKRINDTAKLYFNCRAKNPFVSD